MLSTHHEVIIHLVLVETVQKGLTKWMALDFIMKKTASHHKKKSNFNPKHYERPGITTEEVLEIKEAFDLFDTDGGGSIDPRCTFP